MKNSLLLFALIGCKQAACAQAIAPSKAKDVVLDTMAILGQVRQLSLLPPGEKPSAIGGLPLSPAHRVAVRYQPPSPAHAYDIRSVTLHFNTLFNQSSTGSLLVQLALADSSGAPSNTYLLPAPFVITDKQVRRAPHRTLTLSVQVTGLQLDKNGIFVVLTGALSTTDRFVKDTIVAHKHGKVAHESCIQVQDRRSGAYRLVSTADFITLPVAYTTEQPVTWSFWQRDQHWHRAFTSLPQIPKYKPFNYWIELGVTEL